MEYSEKVMEHFTNPHNVGKLDDADGVGEVGNAKCGDIMKMYLKIENDIITDVKFNTYGCASAIATSSISGQSSFMIIVLPWPVPMLPTPIIPSFIFSIVFPPILHKLGR